MIIGRVLHCTAPFGPFLRGSNYVTVHVGLKQDRLLFVTANIHADELTILPCQLIGYARSEFSEVYGDRFEDRGEFKHPWMDAGTVSRIKSDIPDGDPETARRSIKVPKEKHNKRDDIIGKRMTLLAPVFVQLDNLLEAADPVAAIKRAIRMHGGHGKRNFQHALRYLLFSRDAIGLTDDKHNCGKYLRSTATTKVGRRPKDPQSTPTGWNAHFMAERILEGYKRFKRKGRPLTVVYILVLAEYFKSGPQPSLAQFRYVVNKKYPTLERKKTYTGASNARAASPSKGSVAESLSFFGQRIEWDVAVLKRSFLNIDGTVEPLAVARLVDATSGATIGLGFGPRENAELYLQALFTAVVDKGWLFGLLGVDVWLHAWPEPGLPLGGFFGDRGPQLSNQVAESLNGMVDRLQSARSNTPRDKATVEGSNPKHLRENGFAIRLDRGETTLDGVKSYILDTQVENLTKNVSARLGPYMIANQVAGTPMEIVKYLKGTLDDLTHPMERSTAVRKFLPSKTASFRGDGVHFHGLVYKAELDAGFALLQAKAHTRGAFDVSVYYYEPAVRVLWLEHPEHGIVELEAKLPLHGDLRQFERITHTEWEYLQTEKSKMAAAQRELDREIKKERASMEQAEERARKAAKRANRHPPEDDAEEEGAEEQSHPKKRAA